MSQPLGTLVKAMDVLDALGESAPTGVLELSRRLRMDKSTVSRILTTLRTRGYVRLRETGQYDLGLRMFELGQALQERMPVRETLIPHVDAIAELTGETTFALHYAQQQVAYLYDCVSTQDIRLGERRGLRTSPWSHPAGLSILAFRDEEEVMSELSNARRVSRKGLPTLAAFRERLNEVRQAGYVVHQDDEKCLISVPIHNEITLRVNASLMLGGPAFRISDSKIQEFVEVLKKHAREVSVSLGWLKPTASAARA